MDTILYVDHKTLENKLSADPEGGQPYFVHHLTNRCNNMEVHRMASYTIGLVDQGTMKVETDLFQQAAQAPAVFVIAPPP